MMRRLFISIIFLGATFLFGSPDAFAGSDCSGPHCLDVWSSCGRNTASWGYSVNREAQDACDRAGGGLSCSYSGSAGPGSYTKVPAGRKEVSVTCSCAGVTLEASSSCTVTHLPMIASIQGPSSFTLGDSANWTLSGGYNKNDPASDDTRFDYSISGLPLFSGIDGSASGFGSVSFSSSTRCPSVGQCQYKGYDCCGGGSCSDPVCKIENGKGRYCFNFSSNQWDQIGSCNISCGTYTITADVSGVAPDASARKTVTVNCPPDDSPPPRPQDPPDVNLSANPTSVEDGQSTTLRWTTSGDPDRCSASEGWSGSKTTRGGSESIGVNFGSSTTKRYTITCSKSGYQDAVDRVTVNKREVPPRPDPAPQVTLTASPNSVVPGGQTRLSWTTSGNPDSCRAVTTIGGWFGEKNSNGGSQTVPVYFQNSDTQTYEIVCSKSGHNPARSTATVRKINNPAPQVTLTATPSSLQDGQTTTLKWTTSGNPSSCKAYDGWTGDKNTNGGSEGARVSFGNANSKTYTIVCSKSGHTPARSSVTVTKVTPDADISVDLVATPSSVEDGKPIMLYWYTTGDPTSCTASGGWSRTKDPKGGSESQFVQFGASRQISYTLTCVRGNKRATATATVRKKDSPQNPSISVNLNANPPSVQNGDSTTLSWTTTGNPSSCKAYDGWTGDKNANGGSEVTRVFFGNANSKTYTIVCSKSGYTPARSSVTVTKTNPPQTPSIDVILTATPSSLQDGQTTKLEWTTSGNPTSCTASGDWSGTRDENGGDQSVTVNFGTENSKTYTLTCSKPGVPNKSDRATVTKEQPEIILKKGQDCSGFVAQNIRLKKGHSELITPCDKNGVELDIDSWSWEASSQTCIERQDYDASDTKRFVAIGNNNCSAKAIAKKNGYKDGSAVLGIFENGGGEESIDIEGSQWREVAP